MFTKLFGDPYADMRAEETAEEQRLRALAQMDPIQQTGYAGLASSQLAGEGLRKTIGGFAGADTRSPTQRRVADVEAVKAEVAKLGFDPNDPASADEFHKRVIQILQQRGLAAEAMSVAQDWHKQKKENRKLDLESEDIERKRLKDDQVNQRAIERNDLLKAKLGAAASPVGKLMAAMERATSAQDKAYYKQAIENLLAGKWEAVDLGDRVQLRNKITGEVLDTEQKGLPPRDEVKDKKAKEQAANAYPSFMQGLQRQYDAAVRLHNHPGLSGILGKIGQNVGEEIAKPFLGNIATMLSSSEAGAALALHKQVQGASFLSGLAQLKESSKTGATGLGAVSEKEGDKVQSAAAALDRLQEAPDYRARLREYIAFLEEHAANLAEGATKDAVTAPIPLKKQQLMVPRSDPAASAARRPAAGPLRTAPAPAPTQMPDDGKVEKWDFVNGKLQRVK
jgi:hypothetical protein